MTGRMVRPAHKPLISTGSGERYGRELTSKGPDVARIPTRARRRREFDLWQRAAGVVIGLFAAAVIGPGLLAMDHDRPYRGIFMIVIGAIVILGTIPALRRQSTP